jgi:hypothetical protein
MVRDAKRAASQLLEKFKTTDVLRDGCVKCGNDVAERIARRVGAVNWAEAILGRAPRM